MRSTILSVFIKIAFFTLFLWCLNSYFGWLEKHFVLVSFVPVSDFIFIVLKLSKYLEHSRHGSQEPGEEIGREIFLSREHPTSLSVLPSIGQTTMLRDLLRSSHGSRDRVVL